jgi:hypothetical protein
MNMILARSVGPRLMAHMLDTRSVLNHPHEPVTFLAEVDPHHPEACDAWGYGCGLELGVFLVLETAGFELLTDALASHGHHPDTHRGHLYVDNEAIPIPFDSAVLVRSPEEMAVAAEQAGVLDAAKALRDHRRGLDPEAVLESTRERAQRLSAELESLASLQRRLGQHDPSQLGRRLRAKGLHRGVLDVHPEHLPKTIRDVLEGLGRDLIGG